MGGSRECICWVESKETGIACKVLLIHYFLTSNLTGTWPYNQEAISVTAGLVILFNVFCWVESKETGMACKVLLIHYFWTSNLTGTWPYNQEAISVTAGLVILFNIPISSGYQECQTLFRKFCYLYTLYENIELMNINLRGLRRGKITKDCHIIRFICSRHLILLE